MRVLRTTLNKIAVVLIVVFFLTNCQSLKILKEYQRDYNLLQSIIPKEVFKDFPTRFNRQLAPVGIITPNAIKHGLDYCGVFIEVKSFKDGFQGFYDEKVARYGEDISINSECVFGIFRNNDDKYSDTSFTKCDIIQPIPNISDKLQPFRGIISSNEPTFILMNSSLNTSYLDEYNPTNNLPDRLKKGYSKGIFFDKTKEIAVYFLILW